MPKSVPNFFRIFLNEKVNFSAVCTTCLIYTLWQKYIFCSKTKFCKSLNFHAKINSPFLDFLKTEKLVLPQCVVLETGIKITL